MSGGSGDPLATEDTLGQGGSAYSRAVLDVRGVGSRGRRPEQRAFATSQPLGRRAGRYVGAFREVEVSSAEVFGAFPRRPLAVRLSTRTALSVAGSAFAAVAALAGRVWDEKGLPRGRHGGAAQRPPRGERRGWTDDADHLAERRARRRVRQRARGRLAAVRALPGRGGPRPCAGGHGPPAPVPVGGGRGERRPARLARGAAGRGRHGGRGSLAEERAGRRRRARPGGRSGRSGNGGDVGRLGTASSDIWS